MGCLLEAGQGGEGTSLKCNNVKVPVKEFSLRSYLLVAWLASSCPGGANAARGSRPCPSHPPRAMGMAESRHDPTGGSVNAVLHEGVAGRQVRGTSREKGLPGPPPGHPHRQRHLVHPMYFGRTHTSALDALLATINEPTGKNITKKQKSIFEKLLRA